MSLDDIQAPTEAPNTGIAIPGESVPDSEAPSAPQSDDTESRAKAMGWVPQDEFRGPKDKWRDAAEFVRVGEEDLPVVRERLRDTTRKLTELETRLAERDTKHAQSLASLERMTGIALQRQREQIEGSYAAAMRDAVASGDTARFDQLRRDEVTALNQHDRQAYEAARGPQQPPRVAGPAAHEVPVVEAWVSQNPWFNRDAEMNAVAQAAHVRLGRERPELSLEQNLAEVKKYVERRYADKLGVPAAIPRGPASVEGGTRVASNGGSRSKGAGDLPADARVQGEKFVQQKLFKDINEYARDYFAQ
jgi:hypothetical protein